MGLDSAPFFSMISFSMTWGIGLNGANPRNTAPIMRREYGILSNQLNITFSSVPGAHQRVDACRPVVLRKLGLVELFILFFPLGFFLLFDRFFGCCFIVFFSISSLSHLFYLLEIYMFFFSLVAYHTPWRSKCNIKAG